MSFESVYLCTMADDCGLKQPRLKIAKKNKNSKINWSKKREK